MWTTFKFRSPRLNRMGPDRNQFQFHHLLSSFTVSIVFYISESDTQRTTPPPFPGLHLGIVMLVSSSLCLRVYRMA
ncbi:hypothetical protein F5888DRAFT_15341 [Russula emetica]|nr:hypothetical protein F5888DRAFT_15341 [Russula emetica]